MRDRSRADCGRSEQCGQQRRAFSIHNDVKSICVALEPEQASGYHKAQANPVFICWSLGEGDADMYLLLNACLSSPSLANQMPP